jgi:hypothetical protein
MKENANPIVYTVLEDRLNTDISRMNQVATNYLDPFLSQQDKYSDDSLLLYSSQLILSFHAAIVDILELEKQDKSATRDVCNLLQTSRNVSTVVEEQNRVASKYHPHFSSSSSSVLWQPNISFTTTNITRNQSIIKGERSHDINSHATDVKDRTNERDSISQMEIFNIIRSIQDPEHPLTLEQLNVVNIDSVRFTSHIDYNDGIKHNRDDNSQQEESSVPTIYVAFTPTIPHCSMATLIGLCIKVKLMRSLNNWNIDVRIKKGTHVSETAINRQLNDKERVKASLENEHLLNVVNKCVRGVVAIGN